MNTRCHYCGRNFSLSREAIETAVSAALAANEKIHVEHCPHCRRVIKLPVAQLRRSLPANWTPSAPAEAEPVPETTEPVAEAVAEAGGESGAENEAEADPAKPRRRRRSNHVAEAGPVEATASNQAPTSNTATQTKAPTGKTAAETSAAKKTARKQSKP